METEMSNEILVRCCALTMACLTAHGSAVKAAPIQCEYFADHAFSGFRLFVQGLTAGSVKE